jgi:ubiquinone/menaquinone biosynthesis C-methylase UbiE
MFDEHADKYDGWFMQNRNVLESEVRLVRHALTGMPPAAPGRPSTRPAGKAAESPGRVLSVGCGSGLFESILRSQFGLVIEDGVEPAEGMAKIAEARGIRVRRGAAEQLPFGDAEFDTVLWNGTPAYLADLGRALDEARRVLRPSGHLVVCDVPANSSYGMLYQFAALVGSWDDPRLRRIAPEHPYPIEFVGLAHWRSTEELSALLKEKGFADLRYAQTLTRHPRFSNSLVEDPVEGYDRGDYVAIRGRRS